MQDAAEDTLAEAFVLRRAVVTAKMGLRLITGALVGLSCEQAKRRSHSIKVISSGHTDCAGQSDWILARTNEPLFFRQEETVGLTAFYGQHNAVLKAVSNESGASGFDARNVDVAEAAGWIIAGDEYAGWTEINTITTAVAEELRNRFFPGGVIEGVWYYPVEDPRRLATVLPDLAETGKCEIKGLMIDRGVVEPVDFGELRGVWGFVEDTFGNAALELSAVHKLTYCNLMIRRMPGCREKPGDLESQNEERTTIKKHGGELKNCVWKEWQPWSRANPVGTKDEFVTHFQSKYVYDDGSRMRPSTIKRYTSETL